MAIYGHDEIAMSFNESSMDTRWQEASSCSGLLEPAICYTIEEGKKLIGKNKAQTMKIITNTRKDLINELVDNR